MAARLESSGSPERRILLVDCDAFFVQVARLEDPEGVGREEYLLVGGSSESRGVVTSASYPVREFGVRSGMPMAQALRLCPRAVCVPVPRSACSRRSREVRAVLDRFAPVVGAASIDEFYLDLTGTERLYHDAPLEEVAGVIRRAVLEETRISVSIGGGATRLVAKIAVSCAKPAGVHIVASGREAEFMRQFPVSAIPGIGPRAQERLRRMGLGAVADVVRYDRDALRGLLGTRMGDWLHDRARGIDPTPVRVRPKNRSISREETFPRDIDDDDALTRELLRLSVLLAGDLRSGGVRTKTVTVRIRDGDFTTRQAGRTLPAPIGSDRAIYAVARELLARLRNARHTGARLLGVTASQLSDGAGPVQLSMFGDDAPEDVESERDRKLARAVDDLRERYGAGIILPGEIAGDP